MGLAFVGLPYPGILSVLNVNVLYCSNFRKKHDRQKGGNRPHTRTPLRVQIYRFIVATGGYTRNGKQRRFAKSSLKTKKCV